MNDFLFRESVVAKKLIRIYHANQSIESISVFKRTIQWFKQGEK